MTIENILEYLNNNEGNISPEARIEAIKQIQKNTANILLKAKSDCWESYYKNKCGDKFIPLPEVVEKIHLEIWMFTDKFKTWIDTYPDTISISNILHMLNWIDQNHRVMTRKSMQSFGEMICAACTCSTCRHCNCDTCKKNGYSDYSWEICD